MGALMFDGLTDGVWLMNNGTLSDADIDATATRTSPTGRTFRRSR